MREREAQQPGERRQRRRLDHRQHPPRLAVQERRHEVEDARLHGQRRQREDHQQDGADRGRRQGEVGADDGRGDGDDPEADECDEVAGRGVSVEEARAELAILEARERDPVGPLRKGMGKRQDPGAREQQARRARRQSPHGVLARALAREHGQRQRGGLDGDEEHRERVAARGERHEKRAGDEAGTGDAPDEVDHQRGREYAEGER